MGRVRLHLSTTIRFVNAPNVFRLGSTNNGFSERSGLNGCLCTQRVPLRKQVSLDNGHRFAQLYSSRHGKQIVTGKR